MLFLIQLEPENSVIGRRLLDSSYDFNLSNMRPYPLEPFILTIKVDSLKFRILKTKLRTFPWVSRVPQLKFWQISPGRLTDRQTNRDYNFIYIDVETSSKTICFVTSITL